MRELREYCTGSMEKLTQNLATFSTQRHVARDLNSAWNDIHLDANSLATDFHTAVVLEERIDATLQREIVELLEIAANTIPADVDPRVIEKIRGNIRLVLDPLAEEEEDNDE